MGDRHANGANYGPDASFANVLRLARDCVLVVLLCGAIGAVGGRLHWQSRSFGSIQQALAPEKDTVLVDGLLAQRRLTGGKKASWRLVAAPAGHLAERFEALQGQG